MSTLIWNGTVVTAERTFAAGVLIEGDRIAELRTGIAVGPAAAVIDAAGLYVMPGGIASRHAPGRDHVGRRLRKWYARGGVRRHHYGDRFRHAGERISHARRAGPLAEEGRGQGLQTAKNGALICVHAENGGVIDVIVQCAPAQGKPHAGITHSRVHREPRPRRSTGHCHRRDRGRAGLYRARLFRGRAAGGAGGARWGTAGIRRDVPAILAALDRGIETAGVRRSQLCAHPCAPGNIRRSFAKLWEGLQSGHIQVVSTDHCPFRFADRKSLGRDDFTKIPNGGPGIESRLQLVSHHGVAGCRLNVNRYVELVATAPARIFRMYPNKGTIAPGSDADIVLWDPEADYTISASTHQMRVDCSLYEGYRVKGNARTVILRGEPAAAGI